ncbi:T9SS type A sorting domain-containing protein [Crocinitomix catalasitica]|nr:T9SS type A sorting domain-containing protein [Crocinitomix catalasitica]
MQFSHLTFVFLLYLCAFNSYGQITPPLQPSFGPGGDNYSHASYDSTRYGVDITDMYWLFEPNSPQPDSAAVVVVWHGMTTETDSTQVINMHLGLVKHLARKGYNVIYPLYQYWGNSLTPYNYQRDVCAAIVDSALSRLDDGTHVNPERDASGEILLATTGYSKGGSMSITLASSYWMYGLPRFRAVADFVAFDALAETDSMPAETKILVVLGDNDENIDSFVTVDTVISRYCDLTHIPYENKRLLLVNSDSTGSPALTADHHFYVADPQQPSSIDALDFFGSWKLVTGLLDCAFYGDCDHSLADPDSITYMGLWSNGTPVNAISILEPCPIFGIDDLPEIQTSIVLYPNPFRDKVTIKGIDYQFVDAELKLYNLLGQLERYIQNITGTEFTLERKDLTDGIYFYELTDKNGLLSKGKLIAE